MNYEDYINVVYKDPTFCPVTTYALHVVNNEIVTGNSVRKACERHLNDLRKSSEGGSEWIFDRNRADHIFKFYQSFVKHSKGDLAGTTVKLELWQKFIVGSLMGWIHKETGNRRFTLAYNQLARKNGKSLLSSGLMLYMFMIDKANGDGAEVYTASVKKDTAKIVWTDCMRMVKSSPVLRKHVKVQESYSTLKYGNNVLKALSADSGQDGLNIASYSLDECHLMPSSAMYDVLVSGTGSKASPLGFLITTAGESKGGTSWCYEFYEYCKQILNSTVENDNLFIYIAEMDSENEIHDPNNWIKSNPNLEVSVTLESLKQAYKRATDGGEMDNFLIKHMNMWIQRKDAYFPVDKWGDHPLPQLEGQECFIGIDLSSKLDLTSVSAIFPLENGEYAVLNHNFMPADSVSNKERQDKVPYSRWIKKGYITATTGDVVDIEYIFNYIVELSKKYKIVSCNLDPWNATALEVLLDQEGFTVNEVRQGYRSLSEPIKFTKELMVQEKFIHGNNPVLKWATSNAVPAYDANENVVLSKAKSINRIDPIASTVTAMTQAMLHGNDESLEKHIDENYSIW